jgi:hypothetical protein
MIVVIQCAASKRPNAGSLKTRSGRDVLFVADPTLAPRSDTHVFAHPDDLAEDGKSWRQHLVDYNESGTNPLGLAKAFELYENPAYGELVRKLGVENVFILSAGWGLIRGDFLTPQYDITFSTAVKKDAPWKFRHRRHVFRDLNQLPNDTRAPVFFFGGKDYIPLFSTLSRSIAAERTIVYNSDTPPKEPGCKIERFETTMKTNWHYSAARRFVERL